MYIYTYLHCNTVQHTATHCSVLHSIHAWGNRDSYASLEDSIFSGGTFLYIYIYTYMHTWMHIYIYTYMYIYNFLGLLIFSRYVLNIYMCIYVYIYMYICMYTYISVYIHLYYIHVCICTCNHLQMLIARRYVMQWIFVYTNTRIHTYMRILPTRNKQLNAMPAIRSLFCRALLQKRRIFYKRDYIRARRDYGSYASPSSAHS